jgi:hypothetical protein
MSENRVYAVPAEELNQIRGRLMATEIIAIRLWGALAAAFPDARTYLNTQAEQCLENLKGRKTEGRNEDQIRSFAREAITELFRDLAAVRPGTSHRN